MQHIALILCKKLTSKSLLKEYNISSKIDQVDFFSIWFCFAENSDKHLRYALSLLVNHIMCQLSQGVSVNFQLCITSTKQY